MIYLDTHVVVWLYAGLDEKFSRQGKALLNQSEVGISPIVRLELQYLFEIQRIRADGAMIVDDLAARIGLLIDTQPLTSVVRHALSLNWTRDPFDRLLVATAAIGNDIFLTRDERIRRQYPNARW